MIILWSSAYLSILWSNKLQLKVGLMLVYAKYRGGAFSGKPHTEKRPLETIFVLCLLIIYHQIGFNLRSKNGNHELFSRMSYVKKKPPKSSQRAFASNFSVFFYIWNHDMILYVPFCKSDRIVWAKTPSPVFGPSHLLIRWSPLFSNLKLYNYFD